MSELDIVIRALSVTIVSNLDARAAKLTNELDMFFFFLFFFGFKELESEEGCYSTDFLYCNPDLGIPPMVSDSEIPMIRYPTSVPRSSPNTKLAAPA
jgi:hypothetical protein